MNKFCHADKQVFVLKHSGEICHDEINCRRKGNIEERRERRMNPEGFGPNLLVASVASIKNVHDDEVSEIFLNIKQEAMVENAYDYSDY